MSSKYPEWGVIIVGAGAHGREVASYIHENSVVLKKESFIAFFDDNPIEDLIFNLPRLPLSASRLRELQSDGVQSISFLTAIGNNEARRSLVKRIKEYGIDGLSPWVFRHKSVIVGRDCRIGEGTCVAPGVILTTNVQIGAHSIINVQSSLAHDVRIGDYCNINPGVTVCGHSTVGEGSFIGAGATIIDKIAIGKNVTVGAGAVVINDLPDGVTAVGCPARILTK